MAYATTSLLHHPARVNRHVRISSPLALTRSPVVVLMGWELDRWKRLLFSKAKVDESSSAQRNLKSLVKSSPESDGIVSAEDGVSLGTMKLPLDTDLQRFETLLFQWANSLFQGANLPLPVPLKVDKIPSGARLGFITIGDGETEVLVFIDCLVFPATADSGPIFRAIRNGPLKDKPAPGEPRIMGSLLEALKKSVEIARV